MSKEFTMQELIALLESKSINGKVSLDDIAEIVFDTKFPEQLSQNAVEKLSECSNDFKRFNELRGILLEKYLEALDYQKMIDEINSKGYINQDEEDKIANEICDLKLKQNDIVDTIKSLEDEFNNLQAYFKKVQQQ